MTAPTTSQDVERYLANVRAALADLDLADREDLLEDLHGHLQELASEEPGIDLEVRLGSPSIYAEELRAAAGLVPGNADRISFLERLVGARAVLVRHARSWPGGAAVLGFVPQLRPAWWVLRAFGVIALGDRLLHHNKAYQWGSTLIPSIHANRLYGAMVMLLLVIVSVRIGQASPGARTSMRPILVLANVALVAATFSYFHQLGSRQFSDYGQGYSPAPCCGGIIGPMGQQVSNIYAYDENGTLIPQVQLFDQDGQPLDISTNVVATPGPLHNVFPQRVLQQTGVLNPDGSPMTTPVPAPTIAVPRLAPQEPTPAASPESHPSP